LILKIFIIFNIKNNKKKMEPISVTSNELSIVINNIIKKKLEDASNMGFIEKNKLDELFSKLCIINNIESKNENKIKKTNEIVLEKNDNIRVINYEKFPKKPSVNLPFCNVIVNKWCYGIKLNHGLYTQCTNKKIKNKDYCKTCMKQSNKNKNKLPNNGDITNRKFGEIYIAPNKKKEQSYSKIVKKQNIELKFALREAKKLGWTIPEKQLENLKNIKISPVVSDSSDDDNIEIIDIKIKNASKEFEKESKETENESKETENESKETENESKETDNINNDDDSNENDSDENDSDENDKDDDEYDKLIGKLDKIIIKGINYLLDKEGIMNIYTNNKLIKNLLLDDDGTPIGVYKNKKVYPLEF